MKIGFFSGNEIKNNVSYFLEKHAMEQPNKIAFYFLPKNNINAEKLEHDTITYKEFNKKSTNAANGFLRAGIKKGDRVIIFIPISLELYISIVGLQRIGAIPVFLDALARKEHLTAIIQNAKPIGIISVEKVFQLFNDSLNIFNIKIRISIDLCYGEHCAKFENLLKEGEQKIVPVNQSETALITYTTGSSGAPKGVNRTHLFLAAQHYTLKRLFPYKEDDIDLPVFPVFALNNIASGISTVIPAIDISRPAPSDSKILFTQIQKCNVNNMTLAPSSFRGIAAYCKTNNLFLDAISRVLTGGAPISETDIARFIEIAPNSINWILYGSTEVEPIAYIESGEMLLTKPSQGLKNITEIGVNVGKIDPELSYKFIEVDQGNIAHGINIGNIEIKNGKVGELIVAGESVCRGYYKNKEAFLRAKIKDKDGVVWHRTGDLGRLDRNKYLWIVGRVHSVVERNGGYFFPVRPEIMLKDLPNIVNAAFLSLDLNKKNYIIATVVFSKDVTVSNGMRKKYGKKIKGIFYKEKIPLDDIVFMKDIPMDVRHHSKVDYNKLRKKLYDIFK